MPTAAPASFAPVAETPQASERLESLASHLGQKDHTEASPAAVSPAAVSSPAPAAPAANPAAPVAVPQDAGGAADPAIQNPLPESDATGANLSVDDIAFGARLVAREAEQPSQPAAVHPSQPAERLASTGKSAVTGASSGAAQETAQHVSPSRNGTSPATTQDKSDPEPETNAQAPASTRSEHPVPDGSSIAHADPPNTSAATHHLPVQDAGYAPSTVRGPETGSATPSARTPLSSASSSVRTPETAAPDTPATGAARDIALRLNASDNSAVEIRLSERAGEVRVAVRSADPALTESMRARLPELVDRLGARGFETEIWRPEQPAAEHGGTNPNPDSHREQAWEQQPGNGQQKRQQPQPEWMEELSESLRQPNAVNRSTNK